MSDGAFTSQDFYGYLGGVGSSQFVREGHNTVNEKRAAKKARRQERRASRTERRETFKASKKRVRQAKRTRGITQAAGKPAEESGKLTAARQEVADARVARRAAQQDTDVGRAKGEVKAFVKSKKAVVKAKKQRKKFRKAGPKARETREALTAAKETRKGAKAGLGRRAKRIIKRRRAKKRESGVDLLGRDIPGFNPSDLFPF